MFLECNTGFHSFAGCNSVSSFSRWGKAKPLKLMIKIFRYIEAFFIFGKEITLADSLVNKSECLYVICMAGKKTTLIMLGTACTARVMEKSPVKHYSLLMMLYTSQGQTNRLTFVGRVWWNNRNSLTLFIMVGCKMAKKIV